MSIWANLQTKYFNLKTKCRKEREQPAVAIFDLAKKSNTSLWTRSSGRTRIDSRPAIVLQQREVSSVVTAHTVHHPPPAQKISEITIKKSANGYLMVLSTMMVMVSFSRASLQTHRGSSPHWPYVHTLDRFFLIKQTGNFLGRLPGNIISWKIWTNCKKFEFN